MSFAPYLFMGNGNAFGLDFGFPGFIVARFTGKSKMLIPLREMRGKFRLFTARFCNETQEDRGPRPKKDMSPLVTVNQGQAQFTMIKGLSGTEIVDIEAGFFDMGELHWGEESGVRGLVSELR